MAAVTGAITPLSRGQRPSATITHTWSPKGTLWMPF